MNMANLATANGSAPRHGKSNFRQIVCRHWLRGLCMKGDECTFLHQAIPERMPICQYFSRFGECHQPDGPFKHNEEEVSFFCGSWVKTPGASKCVLARVFHAMLRALFKRKGVSIEA